MICVLTSAKLACRGTRGPWAITMQFPGRGFYTHTSAPRWPPADALLYGVLETYARSRADLGQILTSRTVFSYREPAKIG